MSSESSATICCGSKFWDSNTDRKFRYKINMLWSREFSTGRWAGWSADKRRLRYFGMLSRLIAFLWSAAEYLLLVRGWSPNNFPSLIDFYMVNIFYGKKLILLFLLANYSPTRFRDGIKNADALLKWCVKRTLHCWTEIIAYHLLVSNKPGRVHSMHHWLDSG